MAQGAMATNSTCGRCPALEAENARLRAEIARLKEEIKLLKRRIEYLKNTMRAILGILRGVLHVIEHVLNWSGKVLRQPSGVPPLRWQRHKGRHEVASKLHSSVGAAVRTLEQVLNE